MDSISEWQPICLPTCLLSEHPLPAWNGSLHVVPQVMLIIGLLLHSILGSHPFQEAP